MWTSFLSSFTELSYYILKQDLYKSNAYPLYHIFSSQASLAHGLIKSYKLLNSMSIKPPRPCTKSDLRNFHSEDYLVYLKEKSSDSAEDLEEESLCNEFGLGFDCPVWPGIYDYCLAIAGSTLAAVDEVCNGADIVLNWFGGWHHADGDKAAGYCYVNDIVLGILKSRQNFERVLYIDLDVHHGDGVEHAFEATKRVFTLSFHQHEPGFYPGTGRAEDCGFGAAKGFSANFPYKSAISGDCFKKYFGRIFTNVFERHQPCLIIVQCGGDVIAGDPVGSANVVPEDIKSCLEDVFSKNIPTILLGGGGYNFPNTARYWTSLTGMVCSVELDNDIPGENEHFLSFGPDYQLQISRKNVSDMNDENYLEQTSKLIEGNLERFNVGSD